MLDFETEMSFNHAPLPPGAEVKQPQITTNPDYNPFSNPTGKPIGDSKNGGGQWQAPQLDERQQTNRDNWQQLYANDVVTVESGINSSDTAMSSVSTEEVSDISFFQIANKYIAFAYNSGMWLIEQQAAHERVLFDRFSAIMDSESPMSQQKLFPEVIQFSANDMDIISELWDEIHNLGFQLRKNNDGDIEVIGAPPEFDSEPIQSVFEGMLEHYKNNQINLQLDKHQNMLLSMARNLSVKSGRKLTSEEISALMEALFNSEQQDVSPSGKRIMSFVSVGELADRF